VLMERTVWLSFACSALWGSGALSQAQNCHVRGQLDDRPIDQAAINMAIVWYLVAHIASTLSR